MRDLSELRFIKDAGEAGRLGPSEKQVRDFESHFGLKLPAAYLSLLRHANGGHPELDTITPQGRPDTEAWSVGYFYRLDDDRLGPLSVWNAVTQWRNVLGPSALPFATDGGGNQFFLDLSRAPPSVMLCVHDEGFAIVDIASSFEQFVDCLSRDPEAL